MKRVRNFGWKREHSLFKKKKMKKLSLLLNSVLVNRFGRSVSITNCSGNKCAKPRFVLFLFCPSAGLAKLFRNPDDPGKNTNKIKLQISLTPYR